MLKSQKKSFKLTSPDKNIEAGIEVTDKIQYYVKFQGKQIVEPSSLSLTLENQGVLGVHPELEEVSRQTVDDIIRPVVREKNAVIIDRYNELTLRFGGGYGVILRVYDDGVAYRFVTCFEAGKIRVRSEQVQFNFAGNYNIYFPEEQNFMTQYERTYKYVTLSDVSCDQFSSTPALADISGGPKVLITEADLEDYPGLYLQGSESHSLAGTFPHVATKGEMKTDQDYQVTERAAYIAETNGNRTFPWRVLIIAERDGNLIENQMVYKLASPLRLKDTSWIKPGKAAWNWWSNQNIYDVDFRAGINMQTYKYFIDFASGLGLEYLIIDETWYKTRDLLSVHPGLDIPELVKYGRQNNVGIILWAAWKDLEDQWEQAFNQFSKWGIKGIKLDFMKRDDQWMVNWYWNVAEEAARRKLLVDFHGSYKPAGLRRTYPNVITREAVKGLEQVKGLEEHFHPDWSGDITPEHNLTIPFIRMAVGPMDYTPGAMINAQPENFRAISARPMSQGTRCHQLAMYVVYESPLQMLADSPTNYLRQKDDILKYLSQVPVTWDETRVLEARVGDYVVLARRKENRWYIAAMTDEQARTFRIRLPFLNRDIYTAEIYSDGINADKYAEDYTYSTQRVTPNSELEVQMTTGGGWVGVLTPEE